MVKQPRGGPQVEAEDEEEERIEYQLTEPINAYGEDVKVLKLRMPTGSDLIRVGNPVAFYPNADPVKIEHDMPKMVQMIARLSGVPSSSVERMNPRDLIGVAWVLSPFFIPAP
ncbi:MAG TPA: phage tail assembly protein [Bradyrhizobium sp.]|jgi:hypothetical protein